MREAAMFAAIGQSALLVGAVLVWRFRSLTRPRSVGLLMAFGAGAVMSAVATDLVAVAYAQAGAGPTAFGVLAGSLGYFGLISLLERKGDAEDPLEPVEVELERDATEPAAATPKEARNILVGMLIDGIPESISIGLTLHLGSVGASAALVGAVFVAGLPEAIGVAAALLAGGLALSRILGRFALVVLAGAIAGGLGYQVLVNASDRFIAVVESVAAGAMIVVVVNEMVPIAVRGAARWAGVMAALGFVFAAAMTWASGG